MFLRVILAGTCFTFLAPGKFARCVRFFICFSFSLTFFFFFQLIRFSCFYIMLLMLFFFLSETTVAEAAACTVTSTPSLTGLSVTYNFSCTGTCNYWVLYVLDSSAPLGGRCSVLPCMIETTSIDNEAKLARQSLRLKVSGSWMAVATNGSIVALAQCAYSYQTLTLFRAAVMLRQMQAGASISTLCPTTPTKEDALTLQPATSPPATEGVLNTTNLTDIRPLPGARGGISWR